jgi:hypothetical protein
MALKRRGGSLTDIHTLPAAQRARTPIDSRRLVNS